MVSGLLALVSPAPLGRRVQGGARASMKSPGGELDIRLGLVWGREDFRAAHIGPMGTSRESAWPLCGWDHWDGRTGTQTSAQDREVQAMG